MAEPARSLDPLQSLTPEPMPPNYEAEAVDPQVTQQPMEEQPIGGPPAAELPPAPLPDVNAEVPAEAPVEVGYDAPSELTCDLNSTRIPHISIAVFRETEGFAGVWRATAEDRRMVSTTTNIFDGGLTAAIEKFKGEKTPDLLIVETVSDENILGLEIDALAEVADPGTQLIVVGHRNDISLYQKLLGMGALLVEKKEDSEITVELCSGGVGSCRWRPCRRRRRPRCESLLDRQAATLPTGTLAP